MKSSWIVSISSLAGFLAACTGTTPDKPVETPKTTSTNTANNSGTHRAVPDTTIATVGGAKCSSQNVQQIGAWAKDGGIALGYGEHGGLVAWSSPEGVRVRPLTTAGSTTGSAASIPFPKGVQPVLIAAVGQGFALIARRAEKTGGPCEGPAEAKPGEAAPQNCEKATGYEYFLQQTDLDGKNSNAGRPFHTGIVDIDTVLVGDGRAAGLLTKNEVIWIQKRPDSRLDSERVELPKDDQVIPVRGSGPPAVLLLGKDGGMQLLDERGMHDIDGKFIGMAGKTAPTPAVPAGKTDPKAGAKPGAKPAPGAAGKPAPAPAPNPAGEMIFHSHWGPKGRIEIVRQLGSSAQYAVVEKLVLRMLSDAESQDVRAAFANIVDIQLDNGRLRRMGWDKHTIGEDFDVHTADPAANNALMRVAWSGSSFVFAHLSSPPHQTETQSVGIVALTCGSEKPN